jgi:RND superfamily putative drug exporter
VITSAALIMIAVFLGFVLDDDPRIKMFGLGLATAILVDATIVRMVLVPAIMKLLGNANWWMPRRLRRLSRIALPPLAWASQMEDQPGARQQQAGAGSSDGRQQLLQRHS